MSSPSDAAVAQPPAWSRLAGRVARGRTPAALVDQALVSGANFLTNVLLARIFGLHDYGVFALAWLGVLFANSVQFALVITPMMSIGPKQEREQYPSYFGAVLVQELALAPVLAVLTLIAVALSARFFPQWGIAGLALPLSAATFAYLLQDFLRRFFFTTGRSGLALGCDLVSYCTQLPILFWFRYHGGLSLRSALWIIAATSFAGFVPFFGSYLPIAFHRKAIRQVTLRHWRISRWLISTAFMQWGASNLFLMSAPVYYGAAASALLRASQNIVAVAHVWFLGLDNVIPAEAARQMGRFGVDGLVRYIRRITLLWGGITLAFTAVVALTPELWLRIAYGTKYLSAGYVLRLYAVLYFMTFFAYPLRAALSALEYTKPIFWAYPAMIAFSAALAGPFARQLGIRGVMLGMIGTQVIFQGIIGIAFALRVRQIRRTAAEAVLPSHM